MTNWTTWWCYPITNPRCTYYNWLHWRSWKTSLRNLWTVEGMIQSLSNVTYQGRRGLPRLISYWGISLNGLCRFRKKQLMFFELMRTSGCGGNWYVYSCTIKLCQSKRQLIEWQMHEPDTPKLGSASNVGIGTHRTWDEDTMEQWGDGMVESWSWAQVINDVTEPSPIGCSSSCLPFLSKLCRRPPWHEPSLTWYQSSWVPVVQHCLVWPSR